MIPLYHRIDCGDFGLLHCCDDAFADYVHAAIPEHDKFIALRYDVIVANREGFLGSEFNDIRRYLAERYRLCGAPLDSYILYALSAARDNINASQGQPSLSHMIFERSYYVGVVGVEASLMIPYTNQPYCF